MRVRARARVRVGVRVRVRVRVRVDVRPLAHVPLVVDAVELRPDPVRPEHDGVRVDERACLGLGVGLILGC